MASPFILFYFILFYFLIVKSNENTNLKIFNLPLLKAVTFSINFEDISNS